MFSVEPSIFDQSIVKRCDGPKLVPTCLTVEVSPDCGVGPTPVHLKNGSDP
jgi:hypothetical protein